MSNPRPIACTLPAEAYTTRLSWIADANRRFLRGHRQHELSLELRYAPEAAPLVRELASRERECCAFLEIMVSETEDEVVLRVEAPKEAHEGAAALFAPFLSGALER